MRPRTQKGFSLIELLIGLLIAGIIAVSFYKVLSVAIQFWKHARSRLSASKETRIAIPALYERLSTAKKIINVSLKSNSDGYIQYLDDRNWVVSVYKNSPANQSLFTSNVFPVDSLVLTQTRDHGDIDQVVLVSSVKTFFITTYREDADYFRIASPNNIFVPVALDTISSLKYSLQKSGESEPIQQLVPLIRAPISFSGVLQFGVVPSPKTAYPFLTQEPGLQWTSQGLSFSQDTPFTLADGGYLTPLTRTVKIRNTGLYFSKIQDAINAAVSGNEILVAAKAGGYLESIVLKPGIKLFGGYDATSWERNIYKNATLIVTKTGISDRTVVMRDNTVLDGFVLDGANLIDGIYINNAIGFTVSHCRVQNCDRPFDIVHSQGTLFNNEVTGNEVCVLINDSHVSLSLFRNRFFSNNTFQKANILIQKSQNVDFRNNVVIQGYSCINVIGQSNQYAQCTIANNIIQNADNIGIVSSFGNVFIYNNVIHHNNVGLFYSPFPDNRSLSIIQNNFFANNTLGSTSGGISLDGSNQTASVSESTWTNANPYFHSLATYFLKSNSVLIDSGNSGSSFQDVYLGGQPSFGTLRNDIGLYGGPLSGRLGSGAVVTLSPLSSEQQMQQTLNASVPGDFVVFQPGVYTFIQGLSFKQTLFISGQSADIPLIQNSGNNFTFLVSQGSRLEDLIFINGKAVRCVGTHSFLQGLLFKRCDTGVSAANANGLILDHCTFAHTTVGVVGSLTSLIVKHSIFDGCSLALESDSGTISSVLNAFHAVGIQGSGSVVFTQSLTSDPLFWDANQDNFGLRPESPCIDADGTQDLGAYEYYFYTGHMTSPVIPGNAYKSYKKIKLTLLGDPGTVPDFDPKYGQISIAIVSNGKSVTLSPEVLITTKEKQDLVWTLPPTVISKQLQVRVQLKSYQFGHTPYVNSLEIGW